LESTWLSFKEGKDFELFYGHRAVLDACLQDSNSITFEYKDWDYPVQETISISGGQIKSKQNDIDHRSIDYSRNIVYSLGLYNELVALNINSIVCDADEIGSAVTIKNNDDKYKKYQVVEDGYGRYGIKNPDILSKVIDGTLKICTSHVTKMLGMFKYAEKFNQNISKWDVLKVDLWNSFKEGSPLEDKNTPSKFL
jgi:hypothetical protein